MSFLNFLRAGFFLSALSFLPHAALPQEPTLNRTVIQIPAVAGEYLLTMANAQELPAVVSESRASRQEVIGGSIVLDTDGRYVWSTRYRYTEGGRIEESESSNRGSYALRGATVIFAVEVGDDRFEGNLDGNALTIEVDVPLVYEKIFGQLPTEDSTLQDQAVGPPSPPGPPPDSVAFALSLDPGYLPASFEELCESSILIAEAVVQSVLAPRQELRYPPGVRLLQERTLPIFRYLETDAIFQVTQLFKGSESIQQVVLSQKGGALGSYTELPTQYNLTQEGERYILFLVREARPGLSDIRGISRYALNGDWTGMFRINEGSVQVSRDASGAIREQFDGGASQDLTTEIQRCSQTP